MLGRTISKKKDEEYTRLSGCATIPGILALLSHIKQRFGPVRWLEFMRRGEFIEELLTLYFNVTFD